MLQSIVDDIKAQFSYGNMITKIILVNVFVFFVIIILRAFSPPGTGLFSTIFDQITLSSGTIDTLKKPWTIITHMFVHQGFWHLGWNMIMLYWFGRIFGDLSGDKRVLPLYFIGGIAGAFFYLIYANIAQVTGIAWGASGAVMCFVVAAGFLAPEYVIRLILIGPVRLKYIVLVLVLVDLAMISEGNNTGGSVAHLGGAIMGGLYVYMLRKGVDLTNPLQELGEKMRSKGARKESPAQMTVIHNKKRPISKPNPKRSETVQERIDKILDKINESGYESLSKEEKDFLYEASQKK